MEKAGLSSQTPRPVEAATASGRANRFSGSGKSVQGERPGPRRDPPRADPRPARDLAPETDELGSHVSTAGGVELAPRRAREIGAVCLQLFTKPPNRWTEPTWDPDVPLRFARAKAEEKIQVVGSHDSYLINLASPDPALWQRSVEAFRRELARCAALELDFLVTHPGNATDGDVEGGRDRNAEGLARALAEVRGGTRVLLELTAGGGSTLGGSFEDLAALLARIPPPWRDRVGICFDTCHAFAAGYDLVGDYEGVWAAFEAALGLDRLALFHLNDSRYPLGSRRDRHEHLGEGTLGVEPFRRILQDPRFSAIPKILETPKEPDPVANDRKNLAFLRALRWGGGS